MYLKNRKQLDFPDTLLLLEPSWPHEIIGFLLAAFQKNTLIAGMPDCAIFVFTGYCQVYKSLAVVKILTFQSSCSPSDETSFMFCTEKDARNCKWCLKTQ